MNCHNGEKYLINSLNSIFAQDYHNWELIFWDNKSNDSSKKIIKKYQDKELSISILKNCYHCIMQEIKQLKKQREILYVFRYRRLLE